MPRLFNKHIAMLGSGYIKEIKSQPGYYITTDGRVISTKYRKGHGIKELTQQISNSGYLFVNIKGKIFYIHRLVALAYIPNPENKKEVNHKDLCKTNNDISNLEWATPSENVLHAKKYCKRKSKTSSNAGYLFHYNKQVGYFDSLQQAKIYCKMTFHCSLCTIKDLNVNWKNQLVYVRKINIDSFEIEHFWEEHQNYSLDIKQKHIKQNKILKGSPGIVYKNNQYIGKFTSIREASSNIGSNFKKTSVNNIYKVKDYVFVKQ